MTTPLAIAFARLSPTCIAMQVLSQPESIERGKWEWKYEGFKLASCSVPWMAPDSIWIRGTNTARDNYISTINFDTPADADAWLARATAAIRAALAKLEAP